MTSEQEQLIRACRAFLQNESYEPEGCDITALAAEAARHNLFGVLYCAAQESCAKNERLRRAFEDCIFANGLAHSVCDSAAQALEGAGIRFVTFKGAALDRYYPVPQARTMGDADILIDAQNRAEAKKALCAAGFTCEHCNGPVWEYTKNGMRFEVHTSLVNGRIGSSSAVEFFSDAIEHARFSGLCGSFDLQYHFEYLIAHLAHHICFYGAGIRMVLDLAVMLTYCSVSADEAVKTLSECGLGDFAKAALAICFKWFGVGIDGVSADDEACELIAGHGAFGMSNRNVAAALQRRDLEENAGSCAAAQRLRMLFPPYRRLKDIPYIHFIDGRPYLTPAAWVYRIFYNLRHRKALLKSAAARMSESGTHEEAQNELEILKRIGL